MLDRATLIAHRQRWQAVAAVEAAERQAGTISERWQQLNAIYRLALSLDIMPAAETAVLDAGRRRWQTLYALAQAANQ